ncbi:multidrug transporter [Parageobacillus toebii]|nr:multidrug transporter [Parageobacillus yumthangensis]PUF87798.1 multidrug transporter [Geobacillus sp. LYN3]RDV22607.1 multidrug transporter [Parageobacillus toebii]TXK88441.1 EamA family transporter [Geobacillus sp. AYS3]TXK89727.1 EamA family transporter [Parageobacillus sp. SY1]
MTLLGALGGYYLKKAASQRIGFHISFLSFFAAGGLLYGISAILNIIVLQQLPYTVVFPLTSITYIWTLLLSAILLKETITRQKIIGVLFIIVGSIFLVL